MTAQESVGSECPVSGDVLCRGPGSQQSQVFHQGMSGKTFPMDIPDQLRCLFAGTVEERDDSYVVEIPQSEVQPGETYRVALLPTLSTDESEQSEGDFQSERGPVEPPIAEGDQRTVEIEDIGEQGDGITRVERGFVVIVPDTEQGERVTIEITDVRENVAFADVIERVDYYE